MLCHTNTYKKWSEQRSAPAYPLARDKEQRWTRSELTSVKLHANHFGTHEMFIVLQ